MISLTCLNKKILFSSLYFRNERICWLVIHVTVIRSLPFNWHEICTIKYGGICNGKFVRNSPVLTYTPHPTSFVCKCLLWFFYPHCHRTFSTKAILWTMFCSHILYGERSHYKEHPSSFSFLPLIPSSKDVPSNPFDKVALKHPSVSFNCSQHVYHTCIWAS